MSRENAPPRIVLAHPEKMQKSLVLALLVFAHDAHAWYLGGGCGALVQSHSSQRCSAVPLMQQAKKKKAPKKKTADAAAEDPALQQARTTLMAEIAKEQREMTTIASAIATLEAAPSPAKLKRAITGDWQLVFASDEAAVAPFAVGASSGPFVVLEDIFHRIQTAGDAVQSIEGKLEAQDDFESDSRMNPFLPLDAFASHVFPVPFSRPQDRPIRQQLLVDSRALER